MATTSRGSLAFKARVHAPKTKMDLQAELIQMEGSLAFNKARVSTCAPTSLLSYGR